MFVHVSYGQAIQKNVLFSQTYIFDLFLQQLNNLPLSIHYLAVEVDYYPGEEETDISHAFRSFFFSCNNMFILTGVC